MDYIEIRKKINETPPARCRYNAICESAHMTYKLIKRQADLYNIKRSI